jgi:hypothetical protein
LIARGLWADVIPEAGVQSSETSTAGRFPGCLVAHIGLTEEMTWRNRLELLAARSGFFPILDDDTRAVAVIDTVSAAAPLSWKRFCREAASCVHHGCGFYPVSLT